MTSTSLAQTGQWFPLRTGLFDLSAELVERMGQGERPAGQPTGQTCDELRLIATDSTFYLFSFLVISSNSLFLFSPPLYFAASSSEVVWKQRFFNFKPQTWTVQVQVIIFVHTVFKLGRRTMCCMKQNVSHFLYKMYYFNYCICFAETNML